MYGTYVLDAVTPIMVRVEEFREALLLYLLKQFMERSCTPLACSIASKPLVGVRMGKKSGLPSWKASLPLSSYRPFLSV